MGSHSQLKFRRFMGSFGFISVRVAGGRAARAEWPSDGVAGVGAEATEAANVANVANVNVDAPR